MKKSELTLRQIKIDQIATTFARIAGELVNAFNDLVDFAEVEGLDPDVLRDRMNRAVKGAALAPIDPPPPRPVEKKPAKKLNRKPIEPKVTADPTTPGSVLWNVYATEYVRRYNVNPVRNAATNANAAALVKRLGADDANEVVKFYLSLNDRRYIESMHALRLCLYDAEPLHARWQGQVLSIDGKKIDRANDRESLRKTGHDYLRAKRGGRHA